MVPVRHDGKWGNLQVKDRTSKYPGRVRLVPVDGMANTYTMSWADEPLQEGTPLNKATLLSDTVAAALRLSQNDPTVNDALAGIASGFARVIAEKRDPNIDDEGLYGWLWINTSGGSYKISVCFGKSDEGYLWAPFLSAKRTIKSELFTSSGTFTLPDSALGDVHIWVYGAGGGGERNSNYGGGGGAGGYMGEWSGSLERGKNYSVTIGEGGSPGRTGGASSFDTIISAQGGSGASTAYQKGGDGGSGGGGGYSSDGSFGLSGAGEQFGSGGGRKKLNDDTIVDPTSGVDTTSMDVPNTAKGTGAAGTSGTRGKGGGGGYGGMGGNGTDSGGGGGGGFGAAGNGGNGGGGSGGHGAGGGGSKATSGGYGGGGICLVMYYVMEVVA